MSGLDCEAPGSINGGDSGAEHCEAACMQRSRSCRIVVALNILGSDLYRVLSKAFRCKCTDNVDEKTQYHLAEGEHYILCLGSSFVDTDDEDFFSPLHNSNLCTEQFLPHANLALK